jgi:hypothetical protein
LKTQILLQRITIINEAIERIQADDNASGIYILEFKERRSKAFEFKQKEDIFFKKLGYI